MGSTPNKPKDFAKKNFLKINPEQAGTIANFSVLSGGISAAQHRRIEFSKKVKRKFLSIVILNGLGKNIWASFRTEKCIE